jgi:hypothetical protein
MQESDIIQVTLAGAGLIAGLFLAAIGKRKANRLRTRAIEVSDKLDKAIDASLKVI